MACRKCCLLPPDSSLERMTAPMHRCMKISWDRSTVPTYLTSEPEKDNKYSLFKMLIDEIYFYITTKNKYLHQTFFPFTFYFYHFYIYLHVYTWFVTSPTSPFLPQPHLHFWVEPVLPSSFLIFLKRIHKR
jgi:hypothetical protein